MGNSGNLFMVAYTTSADLSPIVKSTKASLTHPNKNFSQGLLSNLHAKPNISRRPTAPGSHKVKPEPGNDQQQGVCRDTFTWLGQD